MSYPLCIVPSAVVTKLREAGYEYARVTECCAPRCGSWERTYKNKNNPMAPGLCSACALCIIKTRGDMGENASGLGDLEILALVRP